MPGVSGVLGKYVDAFVDGVAAELAALAGDDHRGDVTIDAGELAAAVFDNTVVSDVIARNPGFAIATEFNTGEQYGLAVKKNSNVDLLRTINEVLADLKSGGGYDAIYTKWFGAKQS